MFRVILMCLLTCCSSFMPLKQSESIISEDLTQVVEKKTRENYVKTSSGFYEYGSSDLFSYNFLVGLVNYYSNDLGVEDIGYNSNEPVNNYVIQTSGIYKTFYYLGSLREYRLMFSVANIVLNKTIDDTTNFPKMTYSFIFSNSSPYDKQVSINWNAQRTSDDRLTIWGVGLDLPVGGFSFDSSGQITLADLQGLYSRFMLSEYDSGSFSCFIHNIWNTIESEPQQIAYNQGYSDGFTVGYDSGKSTGYQNGYNAGETAGYQNGFQQGVDDTIASGTEAMTIFSGIMDVAFIPVNVFFLMFNYDVFGINIAGLVSALLTIAVVLIIFRFIAGRKV